MAYSSLFSVGSAKGAEAERPGYFGERHDAYKVLIGQVAEQLSVEDLKAVCWHVDAPAKLRSGSALEVLEYLQKAGRFSERVVQFLSDLLEKVGRVDLREKVDAYSLQYARHSSLPTSTVHPPSHPSSQMAMSHSYSEGSHLTPSTPYQETQPLHLSQQQDQPPHPGPGGVAVQGVRPSSAATGTTGNHHPIHLPFPPPPQSLSMEALPYGSLSRPFGPGVVSSTGMMEATDYQQRSWRDSRSLSNSSSLYLNYNSHPSSRNASQEAFTLHPDASMFLPEPPHLTGEPPLSQLKVVPQFPPVEQPRASSLPRHPPRPFYDPYHHHQVCSNWYQQAAYASVGSTPQEDGGLHMSGWYSTGLDPRLVPPIQHPQHHSSSHHNSATEIASQQLSSSQELHANTPHFRHSLPVQPLLYPQYYTPPYPRRSSTFSHRPSTMRHQSISEYPGREGMPSQPQEFYRKVVPPGQGRVSVESRAVQSGGGSEAHRNEQMVPNPSRKEHPGVTVGILNEKQLPATSKDLNKVHPDDYLSSEKQLKKSKSKPQDVISEEVAVNISNNQDTLEPVPVLRRRTNSLQRESEHRCSPKAKNRLSFQSVDERHTHRELQPQQPSPMHRSSSATCNAPGNRSTSGLTSLAESKASHISSSKGSGIHSNSTLTSEDNLNHLSPAGSLTFKAPKASFSNSTSSSSSLKPHKRKETFLSKLSQQLSRVVRPNKEIEWPVKRSKLNKIIYEQTDKYLTCPYKMELDGGLASSNPKLSLHVHPYGKEEDSNCSVTLEVGLEISTHPKAQRLDSRAEVEVNVRAEDGERKARFGKRVVRESVRLNYFFVKGFISHQELKKSHTDSVVFIISANLISVV